MRSITRSVLICLVALGYSSIVYACNCEERNSFHYRDWNDSPIIFKAVLSDYVRTNQFVKLVFTCTDIIKGKVDKELTIFVKTNESHTLVHGIKRYQIGGSWLVFAEIEKIGNKVYTRLLDSEDSAFCALSRPLLSKDDELLNYIKSISTNRSISIQEMSDDLTSSGKLRRGLPHGPWRYEYASGTICLTEYKKGRKHGYELYYTRSHNGQYIKTRESFYKNNTKQYLKAFDNNGLIREWIVYGAEENFLLRFRGNHLIGKWIYNKASEKTTAYLKKKDGMEVFELKKPIKELR